MKKVKRFAASSIFFCFLLFLVMAGGFGVRLYKINTALADWHSWRQADTASVSRTFLEKGINMLYPRYQDISAIQTGFFNPNGFRYVEFPVFNLFHAGVARLVPRISFEIAGRLVSVICSVISAGCLYFLGRRFIGKWGGLAAAFFFNFIGYNIYFSRVILPEPMAVAFGLLAVCFFVFYIDRPRVWALYLSAIFFALATLVKPYAIFYGLPLGYLAIKKYGVKGVFGNLELFIALDIALIPLFLWRAWINQFSVGIPFWKWTFNGDGIRFRPAFWRWIFGERLGYLILGIWGLLPFSYGVLAKKKEYFNLFFLLGVFLYVATFATASVRHDYYQTFVIPAVSLVLAEGAVGLWKSEQFNRIIARGLLIFSIGMMLGMGAYQAKEYYKINHPEIVAAGKAVDRLTPKDALVIAPYNGDTAFLYQTGRWGWPIVDDGIDYMIEKGADYYVSVNYDNDTNNFLTKFAVVERNKDFVILDLHQPLQK